MKEIWKALIYQGVSYCNFYISNVGKLKNVKTGTYYKLSVSQSGYFGVCVSLGSKNHRKMIKIHKAVAETFIPNPNNLPCVNHKDGNKLNNSVDNLEWCTYSCNTKHAYKMGLCKPNKNVKMSKVIYQYTKDGYLKNSFPSTMDATRKLGNEAYNTHLVACALGKRKSAYGYIWTYDKL